jgi:phosphotransferase system  glucose/maltose/N-acetylglucosamine-specific IIC component
MDKIMSKLPNFNIPRERALPSFGETRQATNFNPFKGETDVALCTPALLTVLFGIALILYDISNGYVYTGMVRLVGVLLFAVILQILCVMKLSWVSWSLFIFLSLFAAIVLGIVIYFVHYSEVKREIDNEKENKNNKEKECGSCNKH